MSEFTVAVHYAADNRAGGSPSRAHTWTFSGQQTLRASAAAEYGGDPEHTNPEEALVAAVSGCHMLTFLVIAAKRGFAVEQYDDAAGGVLGKNAHGRMAVTHITLRPRIRFGGDKQPDAAALDQLHEAAHRNCFVANSLACEVTVAGFSGSRKVFIAPA